jgi:hypothetical protein
MKKIALIITIFLIVGAYLIVKDNDYNLKDDSEDRTSFVKDFTGWLTNLGSNLKEVTGEATKQEWLPTEHNENDSIK